MRLGEARQLGDEPGRTVGEDAVEVEEDEFVLGHSDRHSGITVGGHGVRPRCAPPTPGNRVNAVVNGDA